MRKLTPICLIVLLCSLGLMAQSSGSTTQTPKAGSEPGNIQNPSSVDQTNPTGTSESSTDTSMGQASSSQSSQNGVEGCIVAQSGEYFLVPRDGSPMVLTGSEASQHAGERVKVYGSEKKLGSHDMGAGSSATAGTAGAANATSGSTGSTGNNPPGAIGSTASNTTRATGPFASSENLHAMANKEMAVSRIETVSNTCPGGWNPTFPSQRKGESKAPQQ